MGEPPAWLVPNVTTNTSNGGGKNTTNSTNTTNTTNTTSQNGQTSSSSSSVANFTLNGTNITNGSIVYVIEEAKSNSQLYLLLGILCGLFLFLIGMIVLIAKLCYKYKKQKLKFALKAKIDIKGKYLIRNLSNNSLSSSPF